MSKIKKLGLRKLKVSVFDLSNSFSGNDSNLLIVFYVQIMPDDFVMQLHRF
ncbi:pilus assembly protein [Citrobacter braakii]|nr:pilus assembly protein [Citrobacter braakii]